MEGLSDRLGTKTTALQWWNVLWSRPSWYVFIELYGTLKVVILQFVHESVPRRRILRGPVGPPNNCQFWRRRFERRYNVMHNIFGRLRWFIYIHQVSIIDYLLHVSQSKPYWLRYNVTTQNQLVLRHNSANVPTQRILKLWNRFKLMYLSTYDGLKHLLG